MRKILLLATSTLVLASSAALAQRGDDFEKNYEPIKKSLNAWDPVRGAWLSEAIPAVINQEPTPVRTFPENLTPMEVLALVPVNTRSEIAAASSGLRNDPNDGAFWSDVNSMVNSASCSSVQGRSYGDPHLISFDGERFSFQTVGEFVLAKSGNSRMEVQTRQRPVGDDFSLNTAVAMNVNGDRVCLYATDYPDNFRGTPLRVNGQPVTVVGNNYFLPNGGVVRQSGKSFIVDWPTGESLDARSGVSGSMPFYNVSVNVVNCNNSYSGVLGNADGIGRNDFDGSAWQSPNNIFANNNNNDWERSRSVFVTRDFADHHRVTQATTLFDYGPGQSTFSFTDRSFPRMIRTVNDIDPTQREIARRNCANAGIGQADMNGCIYDNAYLNIAPVPAPPVREPIDPGTVKPVRPTVNTNPAPPVREPIRQVGSVRTPVGGTGTTRPVKTNPTQSTDVREVNTNVSAPREPSEEPTRTRPTRTVTSEPSTPTRSTPTRSTPTPTRTTPTPTRSTPTPTRTAPAPTRSTPTRSTPAPSRSTPTPSRGGGRGGL